MWLWRNEFSPQIMSFWETICLKLALLLLSARSEQNKSEMTVHILQAARDKDYCYCYYCSQRPSSTHDKRIWVKSLECPFKFSQWKSCNKVNKEQTKSEATNNLSCFMCTSKQLIGLFWIYLDSPTGSKCHMREQQAEQTACSQILHGDGKSKRKDNLPPKWFWPDSEETKPLCLFSFCWEKTLCSHGNQQHPIFTFICGVILFYSVQYTCVWIWWILNKPFHHTVHSAVFVRCAINVQIL